MTAKPPERIYLVLEDHCGQDGCDCHGIGEYGGTVWSEDRQCATDIAYQRVSEVPVANDDIYEAITLLSTVAKEGKPTRGVRLGLLRLINRAIEQAKEKA